MSPDSGIFRSSLPVLRHRGLSSVFAYGAGPVSVGRFLADAAALAERLPDAGHVVNLCADRYRFVVGFVAALCRRQVTLLPSSAASAPLAELSHVYPGLYFLRDEAVAAELPAMSFDFPDDLSGPVPAMIPEFPADQRAAILFTSGSTGAPVANPRSWGALVNSSRAAARELGVAELAGACILGTVPHQHSYGLESVVMLALQHGLAFHGTRPLLPADIVATLEKIPVPRLLVTTPVHLRSLVAHAAELPPLHRLICATAPLDPELARAAEDRFATQLHEIYGCTEVGQIAARRTAETLEWSCIDGIELEARGETVWAYGASAAAEAPLSDVIELRGSDRFLLSGRKSDMVNIAGKRSSLAFLNHHLNAVEGVRDGVFVMPRGGDRVMRLAAYVVAPGLRSGDILAALRPHLDPAFLPRPIHFVAALPRNALGKLTRQDMDGLAAKAPDAGVVWSSAEYRFAADHPSGAGHFPGSPIIPGALLLDQAIRTIENSARSLTLRGAKFLRPVKPGDCVTIRWRAVKGEIAFECLLTDSGEPALAGTLKPPGK